MVENFTNMLLGYPKHSTDLTLTNLTSAQKANFGYFLIIKPCLNIVFSTNPIAVSIRLSVLPVINLITPCKVLYSVVRLNIINVPYHGLIRRTGREECFPNHYMNPSCPMPALLI